MVGIEVKRHHLTYFWSKVRGLHLMIVCGQSPGVSEHHLVRVKQHGSSQ